MLGREGGVVLGEHQSSAERPEPRAAVCMPTGTGGGGHCLRPAPKVTRERFQATGQEWFPVLSLRTLFPQIKNFWNPITASMDMNLSKLQEIVEDRGACVRQSSGSERVRGNKSRAVLAEKGTEPRNHVDLTDPATGLVTL